MDAQKIKELIELDTTRQNKNSEWRRYAGGMNPGIFADPAKDEPDNRLPIPFARKAIKTVKGYMFQPGNVVYSGDDLEVSYQPVFDENSEPLTTGCEAESALTYGQAFELHWIDATSGLPYFAEIPIDQCIPIYDNTILNRMVGFIRYYYENDSEYKRKWANVPDIKDAPPLRSGPVVAYYYDEKTVTEYRAKEAGGDFVTGTTKPHGYGMIPVNEFNIDLKNENLFNHVIPLIDWYDKMASEDLADELARFASAYLLLSDQIDNITQDDNGNTELDRIKKSKAFTQLGDDVARKVAFLTKDINGTFIKDAMDRAERLIYEMIGVFNPADIVGTSDPSGIALRYKLIGFEYLCAEIESVFKIGLNRRVKLIYSALKQMGKTPKSDKLDITFRRNLPSNLVEMSDIALKLAGILSEETLLRLLSPAIVPDVEDEMERKAKEESFDFVADSSSGESQNNGQPQNMGEEDKAPDDSEDMD